MPKGPTGQKRPGDVIGTAIKVAKPSLRIERARYGRETHMAMIRFHLRDRILMANIQFGDVFPEVMARDVQTSRESLPPPPSPMCR